jgi:hypothetical protein
VRLSGKYSFSRKRRLSAPERVPPLSMNAIKLSKPLMEYSPEKNQMLKVILIFTSPDENEGGDSRPNPIS